MDTIIRPTMAHIYVCECGHERVIFTDMKVRNTYPCRKCQSEMIKADNL